ncbi:hypothetical protein PFISCL1PPCAC_4904, partial [Pristionchus fissidentatus]
EMLIYLSLLLPLVVAPPVPEIADSSTLQATYAISDLTPKIFVRTDELELNTTSCLQYSFNLMAERVKLRAYECLLGENGYCVMNKHAYVRKSGKATVGCSSLRPWYRHSQTYTFYFTLERRERKYGANRVHRKRARRVRSDGHINAKKVGELTLDGVKPCSEVCNFDEYPVPPKQARVD